MANTVIALKKSGTPSATPSSLEFGELAINYADGVLYYKAANGSIYPFSSGGNAFATVNANGTLVVADTASDVFSLVPGNFIEIAGDGINDSITISANVKPLFDKVNTASKVTMSNTAPNSPSQGEFWWNSDLGRLFVYYNDGDSAQWVEATALLGPDYGLVYDVANSAFDKANTSIAGGLAPIANTANAAFDAANSSFLAANAAFAKANTVASDADEKANAAIITANAAFDAANSAFTKANNAIANTSNVIIYGNLRVTGTLNVGNSTTTITTSNVTANNITVANTLIVNSVDIITTLNSAFTAANNAGSGTTVTAGFAQANAAYSVANAAFSQANTANTTAIAAFNLVNIAIANINFVNTEASAAFAQANIANTTAFYSFNTANAAFDKANTVNTTFQTTVNVTVVENINPGALNINQRGNKNVAVFQSNISITLIDNNANLAVGRPNVTTGTTLDVLGASNAALVLENGVSIMRVANGAFGAINANAAIITLAYNTANASFIAQNADFTATNSVFGMANTVLFPAINSSFAQANTANTTAIAAFAKANSVSGGGISLNAQNTAPTGVANNLWFNTDTGEMYVYFTDWDGTSQWTQINGGSGGGAFKNIEYYHMFFYPGFVDSNVTMYLNMSPTNYSLPANLVGSYARVGTAPTGNNANLRIMKNDTYVGNVSFARNNTNGTFVFANTLTFVPGDVFKIISPVTVDPAMADISISLLGSKT